jgi:uncharacterized protein YciI
MPQYVIVAWDGTDAGATARRQAARPAHMLNVAPLVESGRLVIGGAILNDAGDMTGSVCILDVPTRADVDQWLATDPYVTGKVWQRIEIHPMRISVKAK